MCRTSVANTASSKVVFEVKHVGFTSSVLAYCAAFRRGTRFRLQNKMFQAHRRGERFYGPWQVPFIAMLRYASSKGTHQMLLPEGHLSVFSQNYNE